MEEELSCLGAELIFMTEKYQETSYMCRFSVLTGFVNYRMFMYRNT